MDDLVIDMSHWNVVHDFDEIAAAGVVAMIHKATEGSSYVDDKYYARQNGCREAGLLFGAYHFLRPGDQKQHAKHFVDTAGHIDLYAADHEDPNVSLNDLKTFLNEVEKLTGKTPVLYSGHVIKEQVGNSADQSLAKYPL